MNTITANGSTAAMQTKRGWRYVSGLIGTFGGASVALEWSFDGTTWAPLFDSNGAIAYTVTGQGSDFAAPGNFVRLTTTNAGTTSINYNIAEQVR